MTDKNTRPVFKSAEEERAYETYNYYTDRERARAEAPFISEMIEDRLDKIELTDPELPFVINGGVGLGKTTAVLTLLPPILDDQNNKEVRILLVESRAATRDQLNKVWKEDEEEREKELKKVGENSGLLRIGLSPSGREGATPDEEEKEEKPLIRQEGRISIIQRGALSRMVLRERKGFTSELANYDYIILDEAHSLFGDSSFAEDASIVLDWLKLTRDERPQCIVFITACDGYFKRLIELFIPTLGCSFFFPDFTEYYTGTSIKNLYYVKTSKTDEIVKNIVRCKKGKKGLVFLRSATDVIRSAFYFEDLGHRTAPVLSLYNDTPTSPALREKDYVRLGIKEETVTLGGVSEILERERAKKGLPGVRESLYHKTYPDDIDIIFATDTISEGISIESPAIDYIIIEGFGEDEVEQKSGRYRGDLNDLFLIFYPQNTIRKMQIVEATFAMLQGASQVELAVKYTEQELSKFKFKFIIREERENGYYYYINEAALLAERERMSTYNKLSKGGLAAAQILYGHKSTSKIKELKYGDLRNENVVENIKEVLVKWNGIPLAKDFEEEFREECLEAGLRTAERKMPTFTGCLRLIKKMGYETKRRNLTKREIDIYQIKNDKERRKVPVYDIDNKELVTTIETTFVDPPDN